MIHGQKQRSWRLINREIIHENGIQKICFNPLLEVYSA